MRPLPVVPRTAPNLGQILRPDRPGRCPTNRVGLVMSTFIERHGLVNYRLNQKQTRTRIYPDGPCEITGCKKYAGPLVLDHCAFHGWIRGVLCSGHNVMMASIDNGTPGLGGITNAKLVHFLKCPQCNAQCPREVVAWFAARRVI
jgi:hypothetical protein